jgi:two-component system phosphate regulon sensor histidine kinase PhoR
MMPRSTPKLAVYLLVPYLLAIPALLLGGYLLTRRAVEVASTDAAGSVALQQARAISARLPRDLLPDEFELRCQDEVRGAGARLTVISADGRVLCDSSVAPVTMVNHMQRPEVVAALRRGEGLARRESATVHYPTLYAAVRSGSGADAWIVRVGIPADVVGVPGRFALFAVVGLLGSAALAFVPAVLIANRIGRRLDRMVAFSRGVATGELSRRMPVERQDELGKLEANLNDMADGLRASFRSAQEDSDKVEGILGAMIEGVVVISRSGDVILINRRAEAIFSLASGPDYRGRHLLEMCRDPELQDLLHSLARADGERPEVREITLADAEHRSLSVTVSPVGHRERDGVRFVLVFHDITELNKLETMRRDFVANVSHELRTPLTAIRGYAETLLTGALDDRERARQFLSVIDSHSERLSRLIDDLLTLSDLELGKTPLKREAVQIESIVDEVLAIIGE